MEKGAMRWEKVAGRLFPVILSKMKGLNKSEWSWVFYDWANSAFSTTVLVAFFPIFFKNYYNAGVDPILSTERLGYVSSLASLIIALLAPIMGSIADKGGYRKSLLLQFAGLGVLSTASLFFIGEGAWQVASLVFLLASIGFSGSIVFYDAMLTEVTTEKRFHKVSAAGYSYGYLGGGILFVLNVIMVQKPALFGLSSVTEATKWSFMSVAIWWALFSLPLLKNVHSSQSKKKIEFIAATREGFSQLWHTFLEIKNYKNIFIFLISYMFYIDAVNTIQKMAADYGMSVGISSADIILAILVIQFLGFPFAILGGKLSENWGAKKVILLCITLFLGVTLWAYKMQSSTEFFVLAFVIGISQGPIQAVSRSMFARIIPTDKSGEFFGFYNILGKAAAIFGPALMGLTASLTQDTRASILVCSVFLIAGGALQLLVKEK